MHFIYNIGVRCYWLGILIFSIFNRKAQKWIDGRKNFFLKLPSRPQDKKLVWFHCASLGEFDQGLPLMHKIKQEEPDVFLLVTFFSPSGYDHYHKRDHNSDLVLYLPLDTPRNAGKFINHFRPDQAFFVKYEFWSNYIFEAKNAGARIYNISGLFRPNQHFFKWYGKFFRQTLKKFDMFFLQNEESKQLLNEIGITNAVVSGDCRFDRVLENKKNVTGNKILNSFRGEAGLFVVGSSWPEGEKVIFDWINSTSIKVLIAPHDIGEKHIDFIERHLKRPCLKYTLSDEESASTAEVLILDTIGQLANAYSYGDAAYIGGGFSGSLHNILEPAVFGLPVIFGPKYSRFPEAVEFIREKIGYSINNSASFEAAMALVYGNLDNLKSRTISYVEKNAGATDRIYAKITAS